MLNALDVISLIYLASLDFQVCLLFVYYIDYKNHLPSLINSSFLLFSEQGRRNDIKIGTTIIGTSIMPSIMPPAFDDSRIVPPPLDVSSDSVHCNALTQSSTVSYAFSCHTIDTCGEEQDVVGGRDGRCTHCRG